ncbi:MAG: class I SAM-dependent DNA methyltransferase [Sphingomonadaceae bacterium]
MELGAFIDRWFGREGGAERANYQMFLSELCQTLDLPIPDPKGQGLENYVFEAPVKSQAVLGTKGTGRIDLYKKDCFILEAKQSQVKPGEAIPADAPEEALETVTDLFGNIIGHTASKSKKAPRYDRLMADARVQAERYALALPDNHKTPPFLIVADIGRSFELYFDWAGNGRGYSFFPDQQNYRITLDQLHDEKIRDLLRAIWTNPASVDPRLKAAEVTRDIAKRLSRVAEALELEQRGANPGAPDFALALGIEETSLFLMRILFCMFAEDVELLPKGSFTRFLDEARNKSDRWWQSGLNDLWQAMNHGDEHNRFWNQGDALVRHFNGNLFSSAKVYDLPQEFKGELLEAAKRDWRSVEPAIFGTLLEQVLTKAQRAQLGAHYTPRPYVQRLVSATFGDLLQEEWAEVEEAVRLLLNPSPLAGEEGGALAPEGEGAGAPATKQTKAAQTRRNPSPRPLPQGEREKSAIALIQNFHSRLCALRSRAPACGPGNFLDVSREGLLRLEGKALALAESLGQPITPAVHPNQFLGLELNPRAAVIAELVLWIGWLRHRLANHPTAIGDPVLPTLTNINGGTHGGFDAVLRRTATGEPDTANPMVPDWPKADFIVGNPPFIGGKDIRAKLGGDYAEALWKANPCVPKSADFVMQWWDHAAWLLTRPGTMLRRFGFVTTNSITQTFSRRVIESYLHKSSPERGGGAGEARDGGGSPPETSLEAESPLHPQPVAGGPPPHSGEDAQRLSLILAIPDHPWTKATKDAAAVRIAMTVAEAGTHDGTLLEIVGEEGLETDDPTLEQRQIEGRVNADLTVGADTIGMRALKANEGISFRGVTLIGKGFVVSSAIAKVLGLGSREGLENHIRPYLNGRDLIQKSRRALVIDFFGLKEKEVRTRFPEAYQYLIDNVKTAVWNEKKKMWQGRDVNNRESYKRNWWIFGEPRGEQRPALVGLKRYIATTQTATHRIFQFVDISFLPDQQIITIGSDRAFDLGVLSSEVHFGWVSSAGGTLEDRPRYNNTVCFDPFPFPDATPEQRATIAELAEELDITRKAALAEVPGLTMTEIYNLREWLRQQSPAPLGEGLGVGSVSIAPASNARNAGKGDGMMADRARAARAGIVHRLHEQIDEAVAEAYGWPVDLAPAEIVARLVALNAERAKEEAEGKIRWLRPDYQIPRFGSKK